MIDRLRNRRQFLGVFAGISLGTLGVQTLGLAQSVIRSAGAEKPRSKMPPNATDCHHHIYDSRYPYAAQATLRPSDALVSDYKQLQARLGTSRNVIVQPSSYGTDNRLLLEAITQFNGKARGVAVVTPEVSDFQLKQLHEGSVRGIRFNLAQGGTTTLEMVKPLASRVAPMGWHIQVNAPADVLLGAKELWDALPCPVVFDHLAHVPEPNALQSPVFTMISRLLQEKKAWVKLSGFYMDSKVGQPTYADSVLVARAYAEAAPDRVVWGSDWPHPTEKADNLPDDAILLDLLSECVRDETGRNRVLVDNATRLYQFS
ncbi:MAG: amidohydrolase family protein [Burkholderiaceae bacterium]|jgi:predicted TIM-barrel fold metal-dependent hydrolase